MTSPTDVLILGAAGQLGSDLVRGAVASGVLTASCTRQDLDITDASSVTATMERIRPTVVINSCSFTNVEQCEEHPEQAYRVNADAAGIVAHAAALVGARVVYISTDYVFDGLKPPAPEGAVTPETSYQETDPIAPLNVYGASKAAGEEATRTANPNHLVVRVASLFGVAGSRGKGGNFVETILRRSREGGRLQVVCDQWMTPTYTADAAEAIIALARVSATGVVHVANTGACTWHQFATAIVRQAGGAVSVEPIAASAYATKVVRPRNSALGGSRLEAITGRRLRPWPLALTAYLAARHKS